MKEEWGPCQIVDKNVFNFLLYKSYGPAYGLIISKRTLKRHIQGYLNYLSEKHIYYFVLIRILGSGKVTEYYLAKAWEMWATYGTQLSCEDCPVLSDWINLAQTFNFSVLEMCVLLGFLQSYNLKSSSFMFVLLGTKHCPLMAIKRNGISISRTLFSLLHWKYVGVICSRYSGNMSYYFSVFRPRFLFLETNIYLTCSMNTEGPRVSLAALFMGTCHIKDLVSFLASGYPRSRYPTCSRIQMKIISSPYVNSGSTSFYSPHSPHS